MRTTRSQECAPIASPGDSPPSIHTAPAGFAGKGLDPQAARDWLYAFAIQSLDYALLVVDSDKRVLWANPGAGWILAATQAEIVGSDLRQFFTAEDRATGIPDHEQRSAVRQGASDDDRWMLRADGSPFWASGKTIALSGNDGIAMGFFKIFRDQTEVKMRIDALANQVPEPAPALDGGTSATATGEVLSLEEEVRAAIDLATSRQPVGSRSIAVLFPQGAIQVRGDRERLREAVALLVENAIRATASDGRIWINGTPKDDQAAVRFEDNGRGIAGDMLARVYRLLTRPARTSDEPGTDLARARAIIESQGGTLQARSAGAGKGSEFVLNLPLAD